MTALDADTLLAVRKKVMDRTAAAINADAAALRGPGPFSTVELERQKAVRSTLQGVLDDVDALLRQAPMPASAGRAS